MGLEDKHQDVMQNIEFMIVSVYKDNPSMRDKNAIKALQSLIKHYRALSAGRTPVDPDLNELELDIFERVNVILDERKAGFPNLGGTPNESSQRRSRFSRAFKEPTHDEISLACLRKLEGSAKFWTKERGLQGYLNYIKQFIK